MTAFIGRREFITLLGGAVAWPLVAHAQQPAVPLIGFLSAGNFDLLRDEVAAFGRGLKQMGYVEGQNTSVEYRWAEHRFERLSGLAEELVRRPVAVITATGGDQSVVAAHLATATIPIVFTLGADPMKLGLVRSLNRPGGNATGITQFTAALEPKRLELLRELIPSATLIGVLLNPDQVAFEFAGDRCPGSSAQCRTADHHRYREHRKRNYRRLREPDFNSVSARC